jgi:hypothetical protein
MRRNDAPRERLSFTLNHHTSTNGEIIMTTKATINRTNRQAADPYLRRVLSLIRLLDKGA